MPGVTDAGDGGPAGLIQNLTGGELQGQYEIFITSCKSQGETDYQAVIYATAGLTAVVYHARVLPLAVAVLLDHSSNAVISLCAGKLFSRDPGTVADGVVGVETQQQ